MITSWNVERQIDRTSIFFVRYSIFPDDNYHNTLLEYKSWNLNNMNQGKIPCC